MVGWWARCATIGCVVALGSLAAGCSSSTKRVILNPVVPTTVIVSHERDALEFRVVQGSVPYASSAAAATTLPGGIGPGDTCRDGKIATPPNKVRAAAQVVLPDRAKTFCYELGPTILTGHDISSAQALVNTTTAEWEVNLHFAHDEFVTKVATPYVHQEVAVVFHDVVESAPLINPGITGSDVTISGSFDSAVAHDIARRLSS